MDLGFIFLVGLVVVVIAVSRRNAQTARAKGVTPSLNGFASNLSGMRLLGLWIGSLVVAFLCVVFSAAAPILVGALLWLSIGFPIAVTVLWARSRARVKRGAAAP